MFFGERCLLFLCEDFDDLPLLLLEDLCRGDFDFSLAGLAVCFICLYGHWLILHLSPYLQSRGCQ